MPELPEGVELLHDAIFRAIEPDAEDLGTDETYGDAVKRVLRHDLPQLHKAWAEQWLLSEEVLRAFDSCLGEVFDQDDLPAMPDYRRAMEAAIQATTGGGEG